MTRSGNISYLSFLEDDCLATSLEVALATLRSYRAMALQDEGLGRMSPEEIAAMDAELARIERLVREKAAAGELPLEGLGTWEQYRGSQLAE